VPRRTSNANRERVHVMTKNRARIAILGEVLAFPSLGSVNWTFCYFDKEPQVGDLVSMNCASPSKYYLSWMREINQNNGWPAYLLESIDDGELCWWSNIGLSYFDRKMITDRPSWKWDDEQFAFKDRWNKVCYKKNDAYIVIPCPPAFMDDGSVLLDVRIRYGLSDYRNPINFPSWKKLTMKAMDEYYKNSSKEYMARVAISPPAAKNNR